MHQYNWPGLGEFMTASRQINIQWIWNHSPSVIISANIHTHCTINQSCHICFFGNDQSLPPKSGTKHRLCKTIEIQHVTFSLHPFAQQGPAESHTSAERNKWKKLKKRRNKSNSYSVQKHCSNVKVLRCLKWSVHLIDIH